MSTKKSIGSEAIKSLENVIDCVNKLVEFDPADNTKEAANSAKLSQSAICPECGGTGNPCNSNVISICDKCKGTGKLPDGA